MLNRREHLLGLAMALLAAPGGLSAAAPGRRAAPAGRPFSWDWLKGEALRVAQAPWREPRAFHGAHAIDFDAVGQIGYRPDKTLWPDGGDAAVRFFPLNRYANVPVDIFVVEGGMARPFPFSTGLFSTAPSRHGVAPEIPPGFAGMRFMNPGGKGDWLAFQGASYFRSAGALDQYGLSARALAVNTGIDGREEFPIFTRFWLERGPGDAVTVHALLEGKSVTGAWRFVNRRGKAGVTQDVSLVLWLRADVERLGFAPLTSMFWYGEGNRRQAIDWRPEIHDSDGLELFTGAGERIWRPLGNPSRPIVNSFADKGPRGFGLFQRDRDFDHYQDDGAFYEKRPDLWVEPQGDWGTGAVMLYEIPTERETDDNIVAFWTPSAPARAGNHYALDYRLNWIAADPEQGALARAVDCWTGIAGRPGTEPIPGARRLVADFSGRKLVGLTRESDVAAVISIGGGKLIESHAYPVVGKPGLWRLIVDVARSGVGPTDLRAYLRHDGDALSETLLYQFD